MNPLSSLPRGDTHHDVRNKRTRCPGTRRNNHVVVEYIYGIPTLPRRVACERDAAPRCVCGRDVVAWRGPDLRTSKSRSECRRSRAVAAQESIIQGLRGLRSCVRLRWRLFVVPDMACIVLNMACDLAWCLLGAMQWYAFLRVRRWPRTWLCALLGTQLMLHIRAEMSWS